MRTNSIIVICGKKGAGKSVYCQRLLPSLVGSKIILDTMLEYDLSGHYFYSFDDLAFWYLEQKPKNFTAICRFSSDDDFDRLFQFSLLVGNLTLLADELGLYTDLDSFEGVVQVGRHKNLNLITATQRPFNIPRRLTVNADGFIVFKTTEPRDLTYFYELFGEEALGLKDLEEFEYTKGNLLNSYKFFGNPRFLNLELDKIE